MTKPVALVYYDNLLSGNQLVNRLQDLSYRVLVVNDLNRLVPEAVSAKAIVFVANFGAPANLVNAAIKVLRAHSDTAHIPVLAFLRSAGKKSLDKKLTDSVRVAGATVIAGEEEGIRKQLPLLLEQAFEID
jgi:hypothetical protein